MELVVDFEGTKRPLSELIAAAQPDHALERSFYCDPTIYERDVSHIFMRDWLYAGHVSQVPEAGDYFLFDVADESVIVARGNDGEIHALINVCRHRGSRVCVKRAGKAKKFVCPYHAWTYGLDGSLAAARLMPEGFDTSDLGLKAIKVKVFHGFIFVSFADNPPDFAAAERDLESRLRPYRFDQAKVVRAESFRIKANWKLMLENYIECYHCATAHPEFSRSHSIKLPRERSAALQGEMMARAAEIGLAEPFIDRSWEHGFDEVQVYYDRYALYTGYQTGSEDGKPLAPLMGDIGGFDGGAMNLQIGPITYFLAYNDHVVVYRFIARGLQETDADVIWLVDGKAEEGKDFDLERLTWLWQVTTEADKRIVERNQEGVNSRFYEPGPYAPMEWHSSRFVGWYLDAIG